MTWNKQSHTKVCAKRNKKSNIQRQKYNLTYTHVHKHIDTHNIYTIKSTLPHPQIKTKLHPNKPQKYTRTQTQSNTLSQTKRSRKTNATKHNSQNTHILSPFPLNAHVYTHVQKHRHTHMCTHTHPQKPRQLHTNTHTNIHTKTHINRHTHKYIYKHML